MALENGPVSGPQDLDTILALQAAEPPPAPPVDSSDQDSDDTRSSESGSSSTDGGTSPNSIDGPLLFQVEGVGLTSTRPSRAPTFYGHMSGGETAGVSHFRPRDFSQLTFGETINRKEVLEKFGHGSPNTKNLAAFLDMIAYSEGTIQNPNSENGYNVKVGGGVFHNNYKDHPRESIHIGRLGLNSTAAGRYQFLTTTWDGLASQLRLPDFSPASQDAAALQLVKQCGALQDVLDGNIELALHKCAGIWASFPGSPYGQGGLSLQAELQAFNASLKKIDQNEHGLDTSALVEKPKNYRAELTGAVPTFDPKHVLYIGDSIGDGSRDAAGGGLNAYIPGGRDLTVQGRGPYDVLSSIQRNAQQIKQLADYAQQHGHPFNIVLSGGSSNSGNTKFVRDEIEALKALGIAPAQIVLLGTGARHDIVTLNSTLDKLATEEGVAFTGPLNPDLLRYVGSQDNWDYGIHPTKDGYAYLFNQSIPKALANVNPNIVTSVASNSAEKVPNLDSASSNTTNSASVDTLAKLKKIAADIPPATDKSKPAITIPPANKPKVSDVLVAHS